MTYEEKLKEEFPELWNSNGTLASGEQTWSRFGERFDIKLKNNDYEGLRKEIYEYLKENPEMASFINL